MSVVWKSNTSVRKWKLCRPCVLFRDKYDEVEQLKARVGCMDDLLTGIYFYWMYIFTLKINIVVRMKVHTHIYMLIQE